MEVAPHPSPTYLMAILRVFTNQVEGPATSQEKTSSSVTDMLIKGPQRVFTIVDNLLQSHLLIVNKIFSPV